MSFNHELDDSNDLEPLRPTTNRFLFAKIREIRGQKDFDLCHSPNHRRLNFPARIRLLRQNFRTVKRGIARFSADSRAGFRSGNRIRLGIRIGLGFPAAACSSCSRAAHSALQTVSEYSCWILSLAWRESRVQSSGSSRSRRMAETKESPRSSTNNPVTPSSTSSGMPLRIRRHTGTQPHAIASISAIGSPS